MNRRDFLQTTAASLAVATLPLPAQAASAAPNRTFTIDLVWGAIGVATNQTGAIELAAQHGFESVGADAGFLANLSEGALAELLARLRAKGLVFGAAGLPIDFRGDQNRFADSLRDLPRIAAALERAGVHRVGTWITPTSGTLTYLQNFRQHATRLREVAKVLRDHGCRLGLEYVGPKTSWASRRFPFIHTLVELRELIAEIDTGNVGVVLDTWHWWHANDTAADILSLNAKDVVAVDLNDAPAGIPKDEQVDNRRELPAATGVIDAGPFLRALVEIGYDGPVRAEPFNQPLNNLDNDDACARVAAAIRKAFTAAGI